MNDSAISGNRNSDISSGIILLSAAALGLFLANSFLANFYESLSSFTLGPKALHLDLTIRAWATDGLLAIFFFVIGLELKHEFVNGQLRQLRLAAVPIFAAIGGMAVPAAIYVSIIIYLGDSSALKGWAIPTATDIAFALAVFAVFGRGLPVALRLFLLTLAVVDDLLAILVIAIFYAEKLNLWFLVAALVTVAIFGLLVRSKFAFWYLLVPIATLAWALMHESGVHATIAGVLLGLTVPAKEILGETSTREARFTNFWQPISERIALPFFAFFAAGVNLGSFSRAVELLTQPVAIAIIAALVIGKVIGVLAMTALVTSLTKLRLPDAVGMRDLLPIGLLAGVGFTVSLLIADLSFSDSIHSDGAIFAVLVASLLSATLAAFSLRWDSRKARSADMNEDGVPDNPETTEPWS